MTELGREEAWGNADTFVYFVLVAAGGRGGVDGEEGRGMGTGIGRRPKSRSERYRHAGSRQAVLGLVRAPSPSAPSPSPRGDCLGAFPTRNCAVSNSEYTCPPGTTLAEEHLRAGRVRKELTRTWCKPPRTPTGRGTARSPDSTPVAASGGQSVRGGGV